MIKRIVVAGCRHFEDYSAASTYIDMCIYRIRTEHTLIFLSGGCRGADTLGERYANENGFGIEYYPANWKKYGKSAGRKRNLQMAQDCDYVICVCLNAPPSSDSQRSFLCFVFGSIVNMKCYISQQYSFAFWLLGNLRHLFTVIL